MASVAIGLTLAVSGGVHAYHQHVEHQRVAEAAREEQEQELEQANQRRQEYLDQMPDNDLSRDKYVYNEADRALGRDVDSSSARVLSPAEFEEYFHITPEDYQKQCLEKYGINADDFADDTEAEAQQCFDKAKQAEDEYEARSKARREAGLNSVVLGGIMSSRSRHVLMRSYRHCKMVTFLTSRRVKNLR